VKTWIEWLAGREDPVGDIANALKADIVQLEPSGDVLVISGDRSRYLSDTEKNNIANRVK
jgi:hypothetical protein